MTRKRAIILCSLLAVATVLVTIVGCAAPRDMAEFHHTFPQNAATQPDALPSAAPALNPYAALGVPDALFQSATDAWSVHTPQPITADDGGYLTLPFDCYTYSYVKSDSPRVYTHVVLLGHRAQYPTEDTTPQHVQINGEDYKSVTATYTLELYRTPQTVIYDPTDGTYALSESDQSAAHVKVTSLEWHKAAEGTEHLVSDVSIRYDASPDGRFGEAALADMRLQPLNETTYALLDPVDAKEYGLKATEHPSLHGIEVGGIGVGLDGVLEAQGHSLSLTVTFTAPADTPHEQLIALAGSYTIMLPIP